MALAMIEAPEADGRLAAGRAVVECNGGSAGVSLSLIGAVKGEVILWKTLLQFRLSIPGGLASMAV